MLSIKLCTKNSIGAYIYLSPPGVEPEGLKAYGWNIIIYIQKCQIIFTLGLNAAKNTDYMEKSFK